MGGITTMLIHVTQEDIDKGIQRDCARCPLSLAVSRAFGKQVNVGATLICFFTAGIGDSAELPKNALAFRKAFDAGLPVAPFSFETEPGKVNAS